MVHNFPAKRVCISPPTARTLWKTDVTVRYGSADNDKQIGGERGEIFALSKASLRRLCFVAQNTAVEFELMTTLTYPAKWETDGKQVKKHLYKWLKWAKRDCEIDSYLWALEFQGRGAPHFHIFTRGGCLLKSKKACSAKWFEIVDSGDGKHLKAGTRVEALRCTDAAARYAAEYASKPKQKAVPVNYRNVGRFWGNSVNVAPAPISTRKVHGWNDLAYEFKEWQGVDRITEHKPTKILFNGMKYLEEQHDNLQIQE